MTTNQTIDGVPRLRELLERIADPYRREPRAVHLHNADVAELRALLDAPVNPLSELEVLRAAVKELEAMRDARVDTKLAQGVPVAWVECSPAWLKAGGDCATAPRLCVGRNGISHLHPAHAEQPAPVAVVMPERREPKHYWPRFGKLTATARVAAEEWNACIDEVNRLNTKE